MPTVGVSVTLRGERSYEFLDRLMSVAIPRIRDFRGMNPRSFDGRGNYSLGVREQIIFPEIDYDTIDQTRGLDITITTSARTDEEAFALLEAFGFPFARPEGAEAPGAAAAIRREQEAAAKAADEAAAEERIEGIAEELAEEIAEEIVAEELIEEAVDEIVAEHLVDEAAEDIVAEELVEDSYSEAASIPARERLSPPRRPGRDCPCRRARRGADGAADGVQPPPGMAAAIPGYSRARAGHRQNDAPSHRRRHRAPDFGGRRPLSDPCGPWPD